MATARKPDRIGYIISNASSPTWLRSQDSDVPLPKVMSLTLPRSKK